jgi:broad specificity phosphatase PhoE
LRRRVWIARHASRLDFAEPAWAHSAPRPDDPPLSPAGRREACAIARRLEREPIAHLFSSPFLRCVETAEPIAERLRLRIRVEDGLSEWLNREWFPRVPELLSLEDLARRVPAIDLAYGSRGAARHRESGEEALARSGAVARRLVREFAGDLVLVGHGASVLGATAGLLGKEGESLPLDLPYACLFCLVEEDGRFRLEQRASTSHLTARGA